MADWSYEKAPAETGAKLGNLEVYWGTSAAPYVLSG